MEYLESAEKDFAGLIEKLKDEFGGIRTNRPTPKLLEGVGVMYGEQSVPLKQVASIGVEPPRNLIITPWDKGIVAAIAKGVESSGLGVTASAQGDIVRVSLPELTEERKEELAKVVRTMAEQTRIKMRIRRDDAVKLAQKEQDEDTKFTAKDKLQKLVDGFNKSVDELLDAKMGEIFS